ncbi:putative N-acetyltransferase 8B isoform X2 [Hyla sarda]|nr:putative N-acetyltransferase 8B isoform X2 [Hyla sarda]XP_056404182.1 putative N-acetyltransferase 8B isoform X2 [Hyla sarda]XP_056404269.1 putative N-acetyltransferase 8B isoform X2 [Hyla sarda]
MSTYNIRLYKESDRRMVREIFLSGCYEHIPATFYCALRQPQCWLLLMAGLFLPLVTTGSFAYSILGGIGALLMLWIPGGVFFIAHAKWGLAGDLMDIRKYYLEREGYCFWVAELEGEVVGTVAAIPYITPYEKNVELKRMFVASHHRGKGISKLLCRTLIDYARKSGCNAIILSTTSVQSTAMRMYETMGFKPSDPGIHNSVLQLIGMFWVGFRYDISSR